MRVFFLLYMFFVLEGMHTGVFIFDFKNVFSENSFEDV